MSKERDELFKIVEEKTCCELSPYRRRRERQVVILQDIAGSLREIVTELRKQHIDPEVVAKAILDASVDPHQGT